MEQEAVRNQLQRALNGKDGGENIVKILQSIVDIGL